MKPEFSKQLGSVQAAVFNNEGKRSVSVQRRFKKDGKWQSSKSLFPEDVTIAIRLLVEVESHLLQVEE